MQKIIFQTIYTVFIGLFIYSCSEPILPKRVGVKGTLNVPIKVGAVRQNSILTDKMNEIFAAGKQEDTKVYSVDYEDQTVQTFCIYIPIEMTEELNPGNFLKTIDEYINGGMKAEPKEISVPPMPYLGGVIPIREITEQMGIKNTYVPLQSIAGYVETIDFGTSQDDIDSGRGIIGIDFYFDTIPPGLAMKVECYEAEGGNPIYPLLFSDGPKELLPGRSIVFCNDEPRQLALENYQNDEEGKPIRVLYFAMDLQSTDTANPGLWNPAACGFSGNTIEIKGKMRVLRKWTKAKVNLKNALKASAAIGNEYGKFPAEAFDLSRLRDYFDGGFDFNGLEVKIYMDGSDLIDYLGAQLLLKAQYNGKTGTDGENLYHGDLSVNKKPIDMDDYLVKKGKETFYKDKDLPNLSKHDAIIDDDTISDIFRTMPTDLSFIFTIEIEDGKPLTIYPELFNNIDDSGAIKTTLMIMMPLSLKAAGNEKSVISFPDMFGKTDLFGREKPEDLFSEADINYIRMTIDFYDQIFTGGYLFINQEKDLFPQGIRLNGKELVLNFTDEQIKEVETKLIVPSIKVEFDPGGTINIPKKLGIVSIKFEVKGIINIGEL